MVALLRPRAAGLGHRAGVLIARSAGAASQRQSSHTAKAEPHITARLAERVEIDEVTGVGFEKERVIITALSDMVWGVESDDGTTIRRWATTAR